MQAWRISKRAYALDRQGTGARLSGGRWNSQGVAAIYAGLSPEISALEKLVHTGDQLPRDLVLSVLELPDEHDLYTRHGVKDLPIGWDALPSSTSAMKIGDGFLLSSTRLGMIVPSAVMPEAFNVVLNPNHPAFAKVTITVVRMFEFDSRLLG